MSGLTDAAAMSRALELAAQGRGFVSPNPMVGCVIVRDGAILAEGWHHAVGQAHAEPDALQRIGYAAQGATLYVNLEPCCHWGRTPPCTEAVLRSGVTRVVIAMQDPDPRVNGRGIAALRAAGIDVQVGLLADAARQLNERYLVKTVLRRPFVTLKTAMTLDGRTATRDGRSSWITGETARAHCHRERAESQAILVGVGTVLADDPRLTVRDAESLSRGLASPVRVVLDSHLRTPRHSKVLARDGVEVLICTTAAALQSPEAEALRDAGAELLECGSGERVDVDLALRALLERQIVDVFVEGGGTVHGALLDGGLVDRYLVYIAPKVFGGEGAAPVARGLGIADPAKAPALKPFTVRHLGEDLLLETRPKQGPLHAPSPQDLADRRAARPNGEPMFTGIVTSVGSIESIQDVPAGKRIAVRATWESPGYVLGESIAIDGACMTVVHADEQTFAVEVSPESLARTTLGQRQPGEPVNLERALAVGDRMGGHYVTGHIDTTGSLVAIDPAGDCLKMTFSAAGAMRYLVEKGSIAIDGISLTVNGVQDGPETFDVMVIPHTQQETSLRIKTPGDPVNLEFDLLGKYVERLAAFK
ncbi:MAG: bifunctional diaminohydroxyphosphoribosylaminopyrimidine deaminase/5-amino-6-(5-phosphoribosylamino)uracil reductase RibD [Deltaproteobacteria bacterium]|nr:bifunctional diaminohydroxyphosphoribosylaminopyrimidine deaminase/5-amino-6-(5-phosphoribosylamino)uracil reductase RibD [Deltaproteobacteria bacterium]